MPSRADLISVVIPVYNGARFIRDAVDSVRQQNMNTEIIVVDDASTDNTVEIVQTLGSDIRLIRHEFNQRAAATLNTGIRAATGDYIALLDCDDLWMPDKLRLQLDCMQQNPEIQYVLAYVEYFLDEGVEMAPSQRPEWFDKPQPAYLLSCFMGRRGVFDTVGLFNPDLHYAQDTDWFARSFDLKIPFIHLPQVLLRRRFHDSNLTLNSQASSKFLLKALKANLDRKRQTNS